MEFTNVGAGWWKKEEGKVGRYSVKLENGMYMSIFKNTKKEKDNQPDINLTMTAEDAEKIGCMKKSYKKEEPETEEIDVDGIPF